MLDRILVAITKFLLWLRYRIRVTGLEAVAEKGNRGVLFLPNHPALIDPIIVMVYLRMGFRPRALGDKDQIDRFVIRRLAKYCGVRPLPDMAKYGRGARKRTEAALGEIIDDLRAGENMLLYPSGHAYRSRYEDLAGSSAIQTILRALPDIRIVLVRTRGLWGSGFSWAGGHAPSVGETLKKALPSLLISGLFFAPRRDVTIEFVEPADLPRTGGPGWRKQLHTYLEDFYNVDAPPNTYVPYHIWQRGGVRQLPEPARASIAGDVSAVPETTRRIVTDYLRELTGKESFTDDERLAQDLGLDSLARTDMIVWLEKEFGFPQGDSDSLRSVADVHLAACGEGITGRDVELKPIPAKWFADGGGNEKLAVPPCKTITEAFLTQARRNPGKAIVADQTSGVRTYRDLVLAVMVLKKPIEALNGERVGVMLPASVAADATYMATLFAGKTPVMVNWTVGPRNMLHSLNSVGVEHILTSSMLVERLGARGVDFGQAAERFVFLEDLRKQISPWRKLRAAAAARIDWSSLDPARAPEIAAILFTSGSESLPKAVPLTHENLLTNIRDVVSAVRFHREDRLIGMLPPFHSFGLMGATLTPLCLSLPVVHHANPTDSNLLGRLIEAYGVTLLMGTPTFLGGILRAASPQRLASLRIAVTGAEKCPDRVYQALRDKCPNAKALEGYGVTECSPVISLNDYDSPACGTIGKCMASVDWALVNPDTLERVALGRTGMLLVRGPSIFSGYLNFDGPSPFVEFDGKMWYRTSDLVTADSDGVLTFAGRLKRFIKLGGEMISLPAIETVLRDHYESDADEAPVLAVEATPDEEHPEIVLFTTSDLGRDAVNQQIRSAGLSALHNIRRVVRIDEIPLLGTGKADYRELKKILADS